MRVPTCPGVKVIADKLNSFPSEGKRSISVLEWQNNQNNTPISQALPSEMLKQLGKWWGWGGFSWGQGLTQSPLNPFVPGTLCWRKPSPTRPECASDKEFLQKEKWRPQARWVWVRQTKRYCYLYPEEQPSESMGWCCLEIWVRNAFLFPEQHWDVMQLFWPVKAFTAEAQPFFDRMVKVLLQALGGFWWEQKSCLEQKATSCSWSLFSQTARAFEGWTAQPSLASLKTNQ